MSIATYKLFTKTKWMGEERKKVTAVRKWISLASHSTLLSLQVMSIGVPLPLTLPPPTLNSNATNNPPNFTLQIVLGRSFPSCRFNLFFFYFNMFFFTSPFRYRWCDKITTYLTSQNIIKSCIFDSLLKYFRFQDMAAKYHPCTSRPTYHAPRMRRLPAPPPHPAASRPTPLCNLHLKRRK